MKISLTTGCKIEFTESVYTPYIEGEISKFIGERIITGRIVTEGYSKNKGYHFFNIHVYSCDGVNSDQIIINSKIIRRGNIIYPKLKVISYPDNYNELVNEKEHRKLNLRH